MMALPAWAQPANDECAGAILIISADSFATPVNTTGSPSGATAELNRFTSPCAGGSGSMNTLPGVWYRLTGTGSRLHVDTCSGGFDSILMVFCGACDGLTCVASNDDAGGPGNDGVCTPANASASSLAFDSEAGRTYFIWIGDAAGASASALTVSIRSTGPNLAAPLACLGCTYSVPVPTVTELEPCTIASNTVASSNAGCDIPAPAFQNLGAINPGPPVVVVGLAQASKRIEAPFTDIDWFTFTSPSGNFLRFESVTSFPASIQIKDLGSSPGVCPIASPDLLTVTTAACGQMVAQDIKPIMGRTYAVRITHASSDTQGILCGPSAGYYFTLAGAATGACCDSTTGACTEVTFAACAAPSTFQVGSCTPNPCPQPRVCCDIMTGACSVALPNQPCIAGSINLTSAACSPVNTCPQPTACCDPMSGCQVAPPFNMCPAGTLPAPSNTCTPNPCSQPTACCDTTSGACTVAAPGSPCAAGSVAASPASSTCTGVMCPAPITGACCNVINASCSITTQGGCIGDFRGVGVSCAAGACVGACCNPSTGSCSLTTDFLCSGLGSPRGLGTTCTPNPCGGRCCDSSGACTTTIPVGGCPGFYSSGTCSANPCTGRCCDPGSGACTTTIPVAGCGFGNFAPFGSCTPNTCPGRCCSSSGACTTVLADQCSGTFSGGTCSTNPCPGRCCDASGACTTVPANGCGASGIGYISFGACSTDPCPGRCCDLGSGACTSPPPTGGCGSPTDYAPGTCTAFPCSGRCCDSSSGACTTTIPVGGCGFGFYAPFGSCTPSTCLGRCCDSNSGACTTTIPAGGCGGGSYYPSGSCTPNTCPGAQGACCDTTSGACQSITSAACAALMPPGAFQTGTCTPNPCPQPTACCDTTSGACTVALPGNACGVGTVAAMSISCTPGLCPQPTACCDTTSGACTVALPGNTCGVGTVAAMSTSCTPGICPQPLACCNTTTGACTVVLPAQPCAAGSLPAAPLSSVCTPVSCPQPIACCNFITGVCVVVLPGGACAAGSIAAPGSPATCVPYPCPLIGAVGLACPDCTWVNGAFDGVSGQDSHLGGAIPLGAKAADDFFLCEDFVYDLQVISTTLMTTTDPLWVKPIAEIYEDCNGCPGALLYRLDSALVVETGLTHSLAAPDGRPLRIVHASWSINASQQIVNNRNIVLKGGRYWLSVYGRTDNFSLMTPPMYDVTYWGTTGGGRGGNIKGQPARKITGRPTPLYNQFLFDDGCGPTGWRSVTDGCCIGCTDLNFSVCTRPCKILIDNGPARNLPGVALGSTSQYAIGTNSPLETRSADDFVIPPCQAYTICYVEACVLTNCPTFEGVFELYTNDCHKPSYTLHGIPFGGNTYVATKIIDLGFVWTVGTAMYRAYKLEFHDLAIVVPGGTQMWISAGVRYTFSLTEKAFFCYNEPCGPCDIKWNPGRVLTVTSIDLDPPPVGQQPRLGWAALVDDFSFLIAADGNTTPGPINANPPPTCAADFNRDGVLNVTDIFDYLTGWFSGCP